MQILVLGGTSFIGRHLVASLLEEGHGVTVLNRGRTADPLPAEVERLRGDRDEGADGLAALGTRRWDACVDVSGYTVRQVRASVEHLRDRVGRYVFVSTMAVYEDLPPGPITEATPRLAPIADDDETTIDAATYGPLKVRCEDVIEAVFGDRCAFARPQVVAGPHDPYDRFPYWVRRAGEDGPMLGPGDGTDHVQVVDVRDVAALLRTACEEELSGPYNLSGPRVTWARFLGLLGAPDVTWVPADVLDEGDGRWAVPLYQPDGGVRAANMHASHALFVAEGLDVTPLEATIASVRAWLPECPHERWVSREREAALLAAAAASAGAT